MKKCPTHKDLIHLLDENSSARLMNHLDHCPGCHQQMEDERRLDAFFQDNNRPQSPPPYLWTRIESRLTSPVPVLPWYKIFVFTPSAVTAVALVLIFASFIWLGLSPSSVTLSDEDILLAIETSQSDSFSDLSEFEHNPFNGRRHQLVELDENPFKSSPQPKLDMAVDENPFERFVN